MGIQNTVRECFTACVKKKKKRKDECWYLVRETVRHERDLGVSGRHDEAGRVLWCGEDEDGLRNRVVDVAKQQRESSMIKANDRSK